MIKTRLIPGLALAITLAGATPAFSATVEEGLPAPPFNLKTYDGGEISLDSVKGKVTLLTFWATWCVPCREEMPHFEKRFNELKGKGFTVIGVNLRQKPKMIKRFLDKTPVTFPIALDSKGVMSKDYGVMALPSAFLIDREGAVAHILVGLLSEETLDAWLKEQGL